MRQLALAATCILTAILVAAIASADSVGIGIKKTAPISGTGSSGSPLKLDVCLSGSGYESNGTSWACAVHGDITGVTAGSGMTGTATSGAVALEIVASSDFALTADLLDLSTAVTAPGTLAVAGNTTLGDAAGDFLTGTGDFSGFGTTNGPAAFFAATNAIGFHGSTNAEATGFINYYGYSPAGVPGLTQFRNLIVSNGKGANVAIFTGSTKATNLEGLLDVDGTSQLTGLVTATAGVTSPAGLTLTGTGTLTVPTSGNINLNGSSGTDGMVIKNVSGNPQWATQAGLTGIILAPSAITGTNNDYAPTNHATATTIKLSTSAAATLTGLAGGVDGRVLNLCAEASHDITIAMDSGSSTAANRFYGASLDNHFFPAGRYECLRLQYRSSNSRWNIMDSSEFPSAWISSQLVMYSDSHMMVLKGATGPVLSTCGTSPTMVGSDVAGSVTIGTGGTATACTITFAAGWSSTAPSCVVSSRMSARTDLYISAVSTSAFTVSNTAGVAWPASGIFDYHCIGIALTGAPNSSL